MISDIFSVLAKYHFHITFFLIKNSFNKKDLCGTSGPPSPDSDRKQFEKEYKNLLKKDKQLFIIGDLIKNSLDYETKTIKNR